MYVCVCGPRRPGISRYSGLKTITTHRRRSFHLSLRLIGTTGSSLERRLRKFQLNGVTRGKVFSRGCLFLFLFFFPFFVQTGNSVEFIEVLDGFVPFLACQLTEIFKHFYCSPSRVRNILLYYLLLLLILNVLFTIIKYILYYIILIYYLLLLLFIIINS